MKFIVFVSLLSIVICDNGNSQNGKNQNEWNQFKGQYNKAYRDSNEETKRQNIFQTNQDKIDRHNKNADAGLVSYRMAPNQYSDLTDDEYLTQLTGLIMPKNIPTVTIPTIFNSKKKREIPTSFNWTSYGAVTPVQNQGNCGACWAFSAAAALEAQLFIKTGILTPLSVQNLIDCSRPQGNMGCSGGWMGYAFQYVITNRGINSNASYPYTMKNSTCKYNASRIAGTAVKYFGLPANDENYLTQTVGQIGPVSVAIDGSLSTFRFYSSGVYLNATCSKTKLTHAVTVVGYGTDSGSGLDYYVIKNSWGRTWGMSGYGLMSRNQNNSCGIASAAIYPMI